MAERLKANFPFVVTLAAFILYPNFIGADEIKMKIDPPQRLSVRYRMFRTENIFTNLLLDTRTGRLWQVTISIKDDTQSVKELIFSSPNDNTSKTDGRFTLYPTGNMWNWILIDQDMGKVWQCQFSMERKESRFCIPIEEPSYNPIRLPWN